MVGRRLTELPRPAPLPPHPDASEVIHWTDAASGAAFAGVSLGVFKGEIVAIYGKLGSGAAEVAETAFGLAPLTAGTLEVKGEGVTLSGPVPSVAHGVGFLPAERKSGGAFMVRPVAENIAAASWSRMATLGQFLRPSTEARAFQRWHDRLSIRSRNDPRQVMGTLSGGNQQKVLIGRWRERQSDVLVLIEPTRGVDVGARRDIYTALRSLAATGVAILIATSDYEEAVQVADRVYVMAKGRMVAELEGADVTNSRLLAASGG
jgi:ribose transport system ATP-binding protein